MTSPSIIQRIRPLYLIVWVLPVAGLLALAAPAPAQDRVDRSADGTAAITLGTGKAGKALKRQHVVFRQVSPAGGRRLAGGRFRLMLPAGRLTLKPGAVSLRGALSLRRNRRSVTARKLRIKAGKPGAVISARVGGRRISLFRASRKLDLYRIVRKPDGGGEWQDPKWHAEARLKGGLKLTPAAARILRRKLKAKRITAGPAGRIRLHASRLDEPADPPIGDLDDPYETRCGIKATAIGTGDFPSPGSLPVIADGIPVLAGSPDFEWGIKQSLRNYLKMFGGSMHALDGATLIGTQPDGSLGNVNFSLPVTGGEYSPDTGQAVVNTSGTGLFCNRTHGFRVAFSNLTVVIDGAASRIDADVDFNKYGTWTKTQRTTIVDLDASGIAPAVKGDEVTWSQVPGAFTDAGAWPFCASGGPVGTPDICVYKGPSDPEGATELDPIDLTVRAAAPDGP